MNQDELKEKLAALLCEAGGSIIVKDVAHKSVAETDIQYVCDTLKRRITIMNKHSVGDKVFVLGLPRTDEKECRSRVPGKITAIDCIDDEYEYTVCIYIGGTVVGIKTTEDFIETRTTLC